MKKLLFILLCVSVSASAQTPGFRQAGTPNPFVTSVNSNQTFIVDRGGGASPANLTFGSLAKLFAAENDKPVWNVRTYGANNGGSVDAWLGVEAAAAGLRGAGGTLLFPDGTYLLTNVINIQGRTVTGPWANNTGNIHVRGTRLAKLSFTGATNSIEVVNGARFVALQDLHLVGTNSGRFAYPTNDGILLHGPSGITTIDDVSVQNFRTGIYLHDMTGVYARNIVAWSNFVGVATGYKPDGVEVQGRWDRNVYGVFMHMTNGNQHTFYANSFSTVADHGNPKFSGVFGYNDVGLLIPRGIVHVDGAYFEGNGTSIQLGLNSANAYENTYNTTAGGAPVLYLENFDANAANHLRAYRASTIYARGCRWLGSEVRLMNSAADGSTVDSDTAVVVRKSDNSTVTVNNNYRYVAGALLPRSGMSFTNLTDITVGSGLSYSGGTLTATAGGGSYWSDDFSGAPAAMRTNDTAVKHWSDAYWTFDESSGTRRDSVGGCDLVVSGSVSTQTGKVGTSVTNGVAESNHLTGPDSENVRYSGSFSLGGWFSVGGTGGGSGEVTMLGKTNEYRLYYAGFTANRVRFEFGNANLLLNESWTSTSPSGFNNLKFVTVTWDGSTLSGQINGGTVYTTNLSTSAGAITPPTAGSGGVAMLKALSTTGCFGAADEVYYVKRVISSGERSALYNSGNGLAQTFAATRTLNLTAREVSAVRYLVQTNIPPTATTVGTTAPDRWLKLYDADGNLFYVPAWTNH